MELSMEWQTILLIAGTLLSYTLVTLVIPSIVFGPRLMKLPFALRMMGYYCIGNTIILYVVFTLEFLHISYAPTLVLLTLIIYAYFFLHIRGKSFHQFFQELYATVNQLSTKTITIRTIRSRRKPKRDAFKAGAKRIFFEVFLCHIIEWLLLAALIGYGLWLFGSENIQEFGYHANDGTVHTKWINNLVLNDIFSEGIYPFGFHVVIYYLHELFGIRVMDLIRIFGLVTLVYLLLNMVAFMKTIFRHRFLPELGCFIFIGFNAFHEYATWRYIAALPQENAMVFMFPSLAFAIAYFHYKFERGKLESLPPVEVQTLIQSEPTEEEKPAKTKLTRAEKKALIAEKKAQKAKDALLAKRARADEKKDTRFAGAKSKRERREFERLAKEIAKEKKRELKKTEKKKVVKKKPEKKRLAVDPGYEPEAEVLTVDKVIAGTSIPESVLDDTDRLTVDLPTLSDIVPEAESDPAQEKHAADAAEALSESASDTETGVITIENLGAESTQNEDTQEPPKKRPVEPEVVKVRWYQKICRGYLHLNRRVEVSLGREDTLCMFLFALAFAMTIAVHFYATIVAVFLYFAIAFGYGARFFRPKYFIPILKSIFLGIIIAFLPFLVAFALGKQLQGSLMWAVSVMQPAPAQTTVVEETEEYEDTEEGEYTDSGDDSGIAEDSDTDPSGDTKQSDSSQEKSEKKPLFVFKRPAIFDRIAIRFQYILTGANNMLGYYVEWWQLENSFPMAQFFYGMVLILLAAGIILFLPLREYAMTLISMALGEVFILLMLMGSGAGLPSIMENYRVLVFFVPLIGIGCALAVDAVITIVLDWLHWKYVKWIPHFAALAACVLCVFYMYKQDYIRDASFYMERYNALSLNGAITCTSRIMSENKNWTYTIVSTVDEVEMTNLYGYHYEDIVLLHKLEKVNTEGSATQDNFNIFQDDPEDENDPNTYIPTRYVYIYIEKQPVGSSSDYFDDDWRTSSDGAKYKVPAGGSVYNYFDANRWIVMCHMYMWMRKLIQIYPEAITIYYEDNDFICYRLTQGTIPYNLGIDYGYNDADEELVLGDQ